MPEKEIFDYSNISILIKTIDDVTLTFYVKVNFTVKKIKKILKEKNLQWNCFDFWMKII